MSSDLWYVGIILSSVPDLNLSLNAASLSPGSDPYQSTQADISPVPSMLSVISHGFAPSALRIIALSYKTSAGASTSADPGAKLT